MGDVQTPSRPELTPRLRTKLKLLDDLHKPSAGFLILEWVALFRFLDLAYSEGKYARWTAYNRSTRLRQHNRAHSSIRLRTYNRTNTPTRNNIINRSRTFPPFRRSRRKTNQWIVNRLLESGIIYIRPIIRDLDAVKSNPGLRIAGGLWCVSCCERKPWCPYAAV